MSQIAVRTIQGTTNTFNWILTDHLNSATVIVKENGVRSLKPDTPPLEKSATSRAVYRRSTPTAPAPWKGTGQLSQMDAIGLYHYGARFYDPALGRWAQPDTLVPVEVQGVQAWDRYAYVNNNPLRFTDPSGHFALPIIFAIVFAAAIVIPWMTSSTPNTEAVLNPDPQRDATEFKARMDLSVTIMSAGVGAASLAAMAPEVAMYIGSKTNNVSAYSWGADQAGFLIDYSLPDKARSTFKQGKATLNEYKGETKLFRVHSGKKTGAWWMEDKPKSEIQWRIDAAVLPEWNSGEKISTLTVPSGSYLKGWTGEASYQGGFYIGGGNQVYLPYVPEKWITTTDWMPY
jgi:RHS repeat-associated protein